MGFGNRRINYHNLDVAVCTRDEQDLKLKHYLVDRHNNPYVHRYLTIFFENAFEGDVLGKILR